MGVGVGGAAILSETIVGVAINNIIKSIVWKYLSHEIHCRDFIDTTSVGKCYLEGVLSFKSEAIVGVVINNKYYQEYHVKVLFCRLRFILVTSST